MKNYIKKFFPTRNEIIAEEEHFTDVLDLLRTYRISDKLQIVKFEWDDGMKWGVVFRASGRKMDCIEVELKEYRSKFGELITIKNMKKSEVITKVI